MNNLNNNDEIQMQIRKFLKQVGVGTHQIIENELNNNNPSNAKICIRLEIDNKEIKKFETTIKRWYNFAFLLHNCLIIRTYNKYKLHILY